MLPLSHGATIPVASSCVEYLSSLQNHQMVYSGWNIGNNVVVICRGYHGEPTHVHNRLHTICTQVYMFW